MEEEISDALTGLTISNLSTAIELIRAGQVPSLSVGEERPYDPQDFAHHLPKSFEALNNSLKIVSEHGDKINNERAVLVPLLLLCGEHTDGSKPWTQGKHIQVSYKILSGLKRALNRSSVNEILLDQEGDKILRGCINELRPKLEKFRDFPAAQTCFIWLLNHVQFPELSGHVAEFLPFSLRFIDDWETKNKCVGLGCLNHIVSNVSQTELAWYGRSELITDVLCKNLVAHSDIELVGNVCQTWFLLLRKTSHGKFDGKPNAWDAMAKQFLYKMDMASENEMKLCYSRLLPELITGLKESVVRWTKSTLRIMMHYVEQSVDMEIKTNVLKSLLLILERHLSANHSSTVFEMLIRILHDVTTKSCHDQQTNDALALCRKCLYKAVEIFPEDFLNLCHGMDALKVNSNFDSTIENAFKYAADSQKKIETNVTLVMGTK